MSTDQQLDQMTDAQLNELFAAEVAGLDTKTPRQWLSGDGHTIQHAPAHIPAFCSCANYVQPWIESHRYISTFTFVPSKKEWTVSVGDEGATSPSLARAMAIALLRDRRTESLLAARASKGGANP